MQQWEYHTTSLSSAWTEDPEARAYMARRFPNWQKPPKYAIESLGYYLDRYSAQGWELLSIQPIILGRDDEVKYAGGFDSSSAWYFCVFRRPKSVERPA